MNVILITEKTSGHISNMIAIADKVVEESLIPHFITSGTNHESYILSKTKHCYSVYRSVYQIYSLLNRLDPRCVVSSGGRFSLVVLFLAKLRSIPCFIIEPNYYPGLSNIIMSPGSKIYCPFLKYNRLYGGELRLHNGIVRKCEEIFHPELIKREIGIDSKKKVLLVLTGTYGNKAINKGILDVFTNDDNLHIIWQTGKSEFEIHVDTKNVTIYPFIDNVYKMYSIADCVITSAGINSINELLHFGIPFQLVPYPFSKFDHQYHNALYVNNVIRENVFTDNLLLKKVEQNILSENQIDFTIVQDIKNIKGNNSVSFLWIYHLFVGCILYIKFQLFIAIEKIFTQKIKQNLHSDYVYYEHIPIVLKKAIIYSEDAGYEKHNGYPHKLKDYIACMLRLKYFGSGIFQQLIKNLFFEKRGTRIYLIFRKIVEQLLTCVFYWVYSKDLIFEYYVNILLYIDYKCGDVDYFGIKKIAKKLFQKDVRDLDVFECIYVSTTLTKPMYYYRKFLEERKIDYELKKKMFRISYILFVNNVISLDQVTEFVVKLSTFS